jgi:hypothetical protein
MAHPYLRIHLEGLRKTMKRLSQDSWYPCQDLNLGPLDHDVWFDLCCPKAMSLQ